MPGGGIPGGGRPGGGRPGGGMEKSMPIGPLFLGYCLFSCVITDMGTGEASAAAAGGGPEVGGGIDVLGVAVDVGGGTEVLLRTVGSLLGGPTVGIA